ncbi:MAG: DNA polymerase III subunit delta [Lachnospiraceae bacterium]
MKNIAEDIKLNTFRQLYLLYGEEEYLKIQYKKKLLTAFDARPDSMNFSHFTGKGITPLQIHEIMQTLPFLEERRILLIEDSGFFKNKNEEIIEVFENIPEYVYVIFVEAEVDKRGRFYKLVQKKGHAAEFATQTQDTLSKWVLGMMMKEQKKITKENMELFLSRAGTDMTNIANELEKLLSYTAGQEVIEREAIEEICTPQITNRIFDMIRYVTEKRQQEALALYHDLLAAKEPPMKILVLMARQFNQLLQAKQLGEEGRPQQEIAALLKVPPFVVKNFIRCARQYSVERLLQTVEEFADMETDVKSGRMTDILSVELLLVKYSS